MIDRRKKYRKSKKGREKYREQKRRWNQKPATKAKNRVKDKNRRLRLSGDREGRLLVWRDIFGHIRTERLPRWVDGEKEERKNDNEQEP